MTPSQLQPSLTTTSVLIPTLKRPEYLRRCLSALTLQTMQPDIVILVVYYDDTPTIQLATEYQHTFQINTVVVTSPGLVVARNAGIDASHTDLVCMIDDDTEPHTHWLEQIVKDFDEDPTLGGLGGRDHCFDGFTFDVRNADTVGKLQWFGRAIGNHHLGHGHLREVDLLKGANMSFRTIALAHARCDKRLKGIGAQPSEDISLCVAVKKNGWKLAYDPKVSVNHYLGYRSEIRHYVGIARVTDRAGFRIFAYNEVIGLWPIFSPVRRTVFIIWSFIIGTGVCPGLVQAFRFSPQLGLRSWERFALAQQGKWSAVKDLLFTLSRSPS